MLQSAETAEQRAEKGQLQQRALALGPAGPGLVGVGCHWDPLSAAWGLLQWAGAPRFRERELNGSFTDPSLA